jgi:D-alanyl-D-alanine dipeptidase
MLPKKKNKLLRLLITFNILFTFIICVAGSTYLLKNRKKQIPDKIETQIQGKESDSDFVDIRDYMPDITIDSHYATTNNVTDKQLYSYEHPFLRRGTALKLKKANEEFMKMGYTIKVWDAYRPTDVQNILWNQVPDGRYIANPSKGSNHNRGAAVDITLLDSKGNEIHMPTGFDGFSEKADRNFNDVDKSSADNARLLESVMLKNGFTSIYTEWWHFDDSDYKKYDIVQDVIRLMAVKPLTMPEEDNKVKVDILDYSIDLLVNIFEKVNVEKLKNGIDALIEKLSY